MISGIEIRRAPVYDRIAGCQDFLYDRDAMEITRNYQCVLLLIIEIAVSSIYRAREYTEEVDGQPNIFVLQLFYFRILSGID